MNVKTVILKDGPVRVAISSKQNIRYHRHNCYELVYVYEGEVDHVLNGEHHILREGDYFLLSPNDAHKYASINDDPFRIVNFMPTLIDPMFTIETPFEEIIRHPFIGMSYKNLSCSPLAVHFSDRSRRLRHIFINSVTEYKSKKIGYIGVLRAVAVTGIIECLRNVYTDRTCVKTSHLVDSIVEYVENNYKTDISFSQMCKKLGYSTQYVSRVFKEYMGMNFSTYLIQTRINAARSLLLSSDMTIQQIGNEVGYSNMTFFYKEFKKFVGETPLSFRSK